MSLDSNILVIAISVVLLKNGLLPAYGRKCSDLKRIGLLIKLIKFSR